MSALTPEACRNMTLTVPEAARRIGRNPETVRRWIREGRLPATKVGTQHVIDEHDLAAALDEEETLPLPKSWGRTITGEPMPNVVAMIRRSRAGH
jgi:excisionase family DNA binding protein